MQEETKQFSLKEYLSGEYQTLRGVGLDFKKAIALMDANNKTLGSIVHIVGGKMLPFDMNQVGPDAMPSVELTDEGFIEALGKTLSNGCALERLRMLVDLAGQMIEVRESFISKHRKLEDRRDKILGPKDKSGKRMKSESEIKEIKSQPEYQVSLKLSGNVKSTIETLNHRLAYINKKFCELRHAVMNRVLGNMELLYGKYDKHGGFIDTDTQSQFNIKTVIEDIESLDAKMNQKARFA